MQRQYGAIPVHVRDQLAQLEKVVHQILVQAMAAGKVFIITNASEGWVGAAPPPTHNREPYDTLLSDTNATDPSVERSSVPSFLP